MLVLGLGLVCHCQSVLSPLNYYYQITRQQLLSRLAPQKLLKQARKWSRRIPKSALIKRE